MSQSEFDASKMTIQDLFEAREQRKLERSRRLARLPVAKSSKWSNNSIRLFEKH
jgi:hypothetical protein